MPTPKRTTAPAFQWYPKDFLSSSKVLRMSMTERGVYITLLSLCWLDGSLPDDIAALARLAGVKQPQFARMWAGPLHECFIKRHDGRLENERLNRERRKQVEFKRRQSDAANTRWDREKQAENPPIADATALPRHSHGIATAMPEQQSHRNALLSPSAFASPNNTHTQRGGASLVGTEHRRHAACGRVCVPADLHSRFVRALNRPDADDVLREWYLVVDGEWSVGAKKDTPVGGNDYAFWRARYSERWPSADEANKPTHAPRDNRPAWARKPVA